MPETHYLRCPKCGTLFCTQSDRTITCACPDQPPMVEVTERAYNNYLRRKRAKVGGLNLGNYRSGSIGR